MVTVTTIEAFVSASLARRNPGGLSGLSPLEQQCVDEVTAYLDELLAGLVHNLEAEASCQSVDGAGSADDLAAQGLSPFEIFCLGLGQVGVTLIGQLFDAFCKDLQGRKLSPSSLIWVVAARGDALIAYLVQLAQVHGVAFDRQTDGLSADEQLALARLKQSLEQSMDDLLQNALAQHSAPVQ